MLSFNHALLSLSGLELHGDHGGLLLLLKIKQNLYEWNKMSGLEFHLGEGKTIFILQMALPSGNVFKSMGKF